MVRVDLILDNNHQHPFSRRDVLPAKSLQGGTLGFYCTHAYAHSDDGSRKRLPFALKGVDMIIYTVFKSLGLDVEILPVLEPIDDERFTERLRYESEEGEELNGDLVGTGLHGIQLTEMGGYDGDDCPTEVRDSLLVNHLTLQQYLPIEPRS